jgi:hypothetical protein
MDGFFSYGLYASLCHEDQSTGQTQLEHPGASATTPTPTVVWYLAITGESIARLLESGP